MTANSWGIPFLQSLLLWDRVLERKVIFELVFFQDVRWNWKLKVKNFIETSDIDEPRKGLITKMYVYLK